MGYLFDVHTKVLVPDLADFPEVAVLGEDELHLLRELVHVLRFLLKFLRSFEKLFKLQMPQRASGVKYAAGAEYNRGAGWLRRS